jgi:hypothetical protein
MPKRYYLGLNRCFSGLQKEGKREQTPPGKSRPCTRRGPAACMACGFESEIWLRSLPNQKVEAVLRRGLDCDSLNAADFIECSFC